MRPMQLFFDFLKRTHPVHDEKHFVRAQHSRLLHPYDQYQKDNSMRQASYRVS